MNRRVVKSKEIAQSWIAVENGLKFTRTSNHKVIIPHKDYYNFSVSQGFSIKFNVLTTDITSTIPLSKRNLPGSLEGFNYYFLDNLLYIEFFNTVGDTIFAGAPVSINRIYEVIATLNSSTGRAELYLNGELAATSSGTLTGTVSCTTPVTIGGFYGENTKNLTGQASNLVFINKTVTSTEVSQWCSEIGLVPKSLHPYVVGHWTLNHRYGKVAYDSVELYNDAKIASSLPTLTANHGELINYTDAEALGGIYVDHYDKIFRRKTGIHSYTSANSNGADTGSFYVPYKPEFNLTTSDNIEGDLEVIIKSIPTSPFTMISLISSASSPYWQGLSSWMFGVGVGVNSKRFLKLLVNCGNGITSEFTTDIIEKLTDTKKIKIGFRKTGLNTVKMFVEGVEYPVTQTTVGVYTDNLTLVNNREIRIGSYWSNAASPNNDQLIGNVQWFGAKLIIKGVTVLSTEFLPSTNTVFKDNSTLNNNITAQGYVTKLLHDRINYLEAKTGLPEITGALLLDGTHTISFPLSGTVVKYLKGYAVHAWRLKTGKTLTRAEELQLENNGLFANPSKQIQAKLDAYYNFNAIDTSSGNRILDLLGINHAPVTSLDASPFTITLLRNLY